MGADDNTKVIEGEKLTIEDLIALLSRTDARIVLVNCHISIGNDIKGGYTNGTMNWDCKNTPGSKCL